MTKDTKITLEEANNNILLTLDFCQVTLDVFHAEDGYRRREALKEEYKNPPENRRNYVIRKGIDKIGVVAIESILSSTSEIRGLALKPEFRGMGYLPRIIEAIEDKIKEKEKRRGKRREEGRRRRDEGRGKRDEGRGVREEERGRRDEGRGRREEGRGKKLAPESKSFAPESKSFAS